MAQRQAELADKDTMDFNKETALVETILFLESEPLTAKVLANKAQLSEEVTEKCIEHLKEKYNAEDSGIELVMITGGWCLAPKKECLFTDLLTRPGNEMDVICAFMAILEAVKFKMITIFQNKLFGDIKICAREDNNGYVPTEEDLTSN